MSRTVPTAEGGSSGGSGGSVELAPPTPSTGQLDNEAPAWPGGTWWRAREPGEFLAWRLEPGLLAGYRYLSADLLLEGPHLGVFSLELQEGEQGPCFVLRFGLLIDCTARLRLDLGVVDQNRWKLAREGALLKPICEGDRVDLRRVDRIHLRVTRKADAPLRWCMTPLSLHWHEPARLTNPLLPKGPLLDAIGQLRPYDWPGKSRSEQEVATRLRRQADTADDQQWPADFTVPWGGWREQPLAATGFFRTHHDGRRWWLVDPAGHRFWSTGPNVLAPRVHTATVGLEQALTLLPQRDGPFAAALGNDPSAGEIDFLRINLIRAFGPDRWKQQWERLVAGQIRRIGFNSFGNWSDWQAAQRLSLPFVRSLQLNPKHTPMVFRDFPDVFDSRFDRDAHDYAQPLRETADQPGLIGYFLMNEPNWGFASITPAEGMLANGYEGPARHALADWLAQRCGESKQLAQRWGVDATLDEVAHGPWRHGFTERARADLVDFSQRMASRLFERISAAAKRVDPHHLNLGARYHKVPPAWSLAAMDSFDVFSMNCYRETVPPEAVRAIAAQLKRPVLIGEWHFGALDAGLPASGIGRVPDQAQRGMAYRRYIEHAAALPDCVGAHWFTLYDQSALGRGDGETYNIGFFDVAHRPYEPLVAAARESHARLYRVVAGVLQPTDGAPRYCSKLF